jgi:hypothetical protein
MKYGYHIIYLPPYPSVCPSFRPSFCLSYLSFRLSYMSVLPSLLLSTRPFVRRSVSPTCLFVRPSFYVSICLSVCWVYHDSQHSLLIPVWCTQSLALLPHLAAVSLVYSLKWKAKFEGKIVSFQVTKAYMDSKVQFYSPLSSALDGEEWLTLRPGCFFFGK